MKRHPVTNKKKAAKVFNHQNAMTKAINLVPPPMRGGYRL